MTEELKMPELPWGDDLEAWLEVQDGDDIAAAFRAYGAACIAASGVAAPVTGVDKAPESEVTEAATVMVYDRMDPFCAFGMGARWAEARIAATPSQPVAWMILRTGQFSLEQQDERFWTPLIPKNATPSQPVAAEAGAEVLEDAMAMVQDFGDAMLKRGILSGTSDAKGYAKSFDEAKATKDAVSTYLARRLAAPVEVQGAEVTDEMVSAYLTANDAYWKRTDEVPPPPNRWRTGNPKDATRESLRAVFALAGRPAPAAESVRWEICKHCGHDVKEPCHHNDNPNQARNCHWNQERTRVLGTGLVNNRPAAPLSEADVLLRVIQRLNGNLYNLTKEECIREIEKMRAEWCAKLQRKSR